MDNSVSGLVWCPDAESGYAVGNIVDLLHGNRALVKLIARPSNTSKRLELIVDSKGDCFATSAQTSTTTTTSNCKQFDYNSLFPFSKLSLDEFVRLSSVGGNKSVGGADYIDEDVDDNCALMQLNEASLLNNIRVRYFKNKIYTYIANILIAINPYVQIKDLHSEQAIRDYQGKSLGAMPPHVYAIADKAYRDMRANKQSQSIVISGESGAGKTETQKYVLRYLCVRATSQTTQRLEQLILNANPLLEAFGNAKTVRNNNSSRFGKFIELHYSAAQFALVGSRFMHYLLEKSRICSQSSNERNYHIFYQLLSAGALSAEQRAHLSLTTSSLSSFRYLRDGCTRFFSSGDGGDGNRRRGSDYHDDATPLFDPLVDDVACFAKTNAALESFGVSDEQRLAIYKTVAAVLHLGNVEFVEATDGSCGCKLADDAAVESLAIVARLVELDAQFLRQALTTRLMSTCGGGAKGTIYMVQLSVAQARSARDALAKAIYARLFDYIVGSVINTSLPALLKLPPPQTTTTSKVSMPTNTTTTTTTFIGVLDVAGFEYFERNCFEQLLINFCNERLQAFFNARVMRHEQATYDAEGLAVARVPFVDNRAAIELFEARDGLFRLLDDECRLPKPSAANFTRKAHATHGAAPNATTRPATPLAKPRDARHKLRDDEGFAVRHFAGSVCYSTSLFIDKNNDALHHSLRALMQESACGLLRSLFADDDEGGSSTKQASTSTATTTAATTKLGFVSVSATFRAQLAELLAKLEATGAHFVKCVKPNGEMLAARFDGAPVLAQLHCSGMHSVLELMRVGFPSRASFASLYAAYARRLPPSLARLEPRLFCRALFKALGLGDDDFRFGTTRVFFRAGKFREFDDIMAAAADDKRVAELVARATRWLLAARWRRASFAALAAVRLRRKIAERQLATLRLQSCWRAALVARRTSFRLAFLRDARAIGKSVDDFERICAQTAAFKSMPERETLVAESRALRDEVREACARVRHSFHHNDTPAVSEADARREARETGERLATKRDLLVRTIKARMATQVAALEQELAEQRARHASDELERARARELRDERAEFEARRCRELAAEHRATNNNNNTINVPQKVDCGTDPIGELELDALRLSAESHAHDDDDAAFVGRSSFDLRKCRYSELRDTINTSCDIALLEACKREFHRRLREYHAWKAANERRASASSGGGGSEPLRAPLSVLRTAAAGSAALAPPPIVSAAAAAADAKGAPREQRYFRVPFGAKPATLLAASHGAAAAGWWFAHFDGQWIARQLELHAGKQPVLLRAGVDDVSMCELSLAETRLASRRGAEISAREFEAEWQRAESDAGHAPAASTAAGQQR